MKAADKNLEALVMGDEPESSLKFAHSNVHIDLLPVTEAYEEQEHAIDHIESLTEMS